MKTNSHVRTTSTMESGKRVVKRLKALGLGVALMVTPALGLASVLSDLAATLEPGSFVELEVGGSVSTCQAMIPLIPERHPDACAIDEPMPHPDGCLIPTPNYLGNILEFTDEALWDPTDRDVYIMGTRRPYKRWDQGFVKYSEETNSWEILDLPPFGVGAHGYDNGALDTQRREYYWSRIGVARNVWKMDLDTGTWEELPDAPIQAGQFSAIEYFPELKRLVFFDGLGDSEYALYDPESNLWEGPTALADAPFGGISHFSEYNPRDPSDPSDGVMFFGGGYNYSAGGTIPDPTPNVNESRRLYVLDSERVVTRLADAPTRLGQHGVGPMQTIDPNSGNLVVFQGELNDGSCPSGPLPIWEYDLENDTWNQTGEHRVSDLYCRMNSVVVPLYEYGVNFIVSVRSETDCRVHLYRHSPMDPTPPGIVTQPEAVTVAAGEDVSFSVSVSGSGPLSYQWFRDGSAIADATSANYTLTGVSAADNNRVFSVDVSNNLGSVSSNGAVLTVMSDSIAPTLVSAIAASSTRVDVVFSEAVSAGSAQNSANYEVDLGIAVASASLGADERTVSLGVSELTADTAYTVSVSNVQDRAQTPNTIVAQSSRNFSYRTADSFEDGTADGWTPLTPARWSVVMDEGDMAYYLNTSNFSSPGDGRLGEYSLLSADFGDFVFTAQAKLGDDVANNSLADYAVVFGFQDAENYYFVMFNNDQGATQLFRVVSGSRVELATASSDWLVDNLYHSIEVRRAGSEIEVRFDGNLILSASDSSFGAGRVGIGSFNDSAYFDDISVVATATSPPPPPPPPSDDVAPVITLTGANPQSITVGGTYTELGATAMDNVDGNISINVSVNASTVDMATVGSYSVTYNVSDAAGNAATQMLRTVTVTAAAVDEADDDSSGGGGALGPMLGLLLLTFRRRRPSLA